MLYRILAPVSTRLVPGQVIDGQSVENLDSLIRLGMVKEEVVAKRKPAKKATKKG